MRTTILTLTLALAATAAHAEQSASIETATQAFQQARSMSHFANLWARMTGDKACQEIADRASFYALDAGEWIIKANAGTDPQIATTNALRSAKLSVQRAAMCVPSNYTYRGTAVIPYETGAR